MQVIDFDLPYLYVKYITGANVTSSRAKEKIAKFCLGVQEDLGAGQWIGYGTGVQFMPGTAAIPEQQERFNNDIYKPAVVVEPVATEEDS